MHSVHLEYLINTYYVPGFMLSTWNTVMNNTVWLLPLQRVQPNGENPQKMRKPAEEYRITNYTICKYYKVNEQGAEIERGTYFKWSNQRRVVK